MKRCNILEEKLDMCGFRPYSTEFQTPDSGMMGEEWLQLMCCTMLNSRFPIYEMELRRYGQSSEDIQHPTPRSYLMTSKVAERQMRH